MASVSQHEAVDWVALRAKLPPLDKSPESKVIRMKVFKQFDSHGNGYFLYSYIIIVDFLYIFRYIPVALAAHILEV